MIISNGQTKDKLESRVKARRWLTSFTGSLKRGRTVQPLKQGPS